ncbi:hypothetical protein ACWDWS_21950, partial [Streptomyces sp. NPDC003328]
AAVDDPDRSLGLVDVLTAAERDLVLGEWSGRDKDTPLVVPGPGVASHPASPERGHPDGVRPE